MCEEHDRAPADASRERAGRLPAAGPAACPGPAALRALRRVDAVQADACPTDFEGVAIDDSRGSGERRARAHLAERIA